MRWLCSALVGADGWLAVGSDKPSNSLLSSPEEEEDKSNKQPTRWVRAGNTFSTVCALTVVPGVRWTHPFWSQCSLPHHSWPGTFWALRSLCQRIQMEGHRSLNLQCLEGASPDLWRLVKHPRVKTSVRVYRNEKQIEVQLPFLLK